MQKVGDDQRSESSDHLEVPLCSLFSYSEGSTVTRRATFVLLTALPLMGCGGQDTMPTEEKEANVEEVAPDEALMEAYSATGFPILGEKAFWTG
jgi:hypothetical protein